MIVRRYLIILKVAIVLLWVSSGRANAFDDGFVSAQKIQGAHFTIYCAPGVSIPVLIEQLGVGATDALLAGKGAGVTEYAAQDFAQTMDTFFIRICDILDMRLYGFQGNIKVCNDQAELEKIYLDLREGNLDPGVHSFYSHSLNTIYVSVAGVTRSILGHEIAHAVISNYFVVPPSVRVQEVLAGYVEYQLCNNPKQANNPE